MYNTGHCTGYLQIRRPIYLCCRREHSYGYISVGSNLWWPTPTRDAHQVQRRKREKEIRTTTQTQPRTREGPCDALSLVKCLHRPNPPLLVSSFHFPCEPVDCNQFRCKILSRPLQSLMCDVASSSEAPEMADARPVMHDDSEKKPPRFVKCLMVKTSLGEKKGTCLRIHRMTLGLPAYREYIAGPGTDPAQKKQ